MKLLSYINKYNLEIKIIENISIDIIMCVLVLFVVIFFIKFINNNKKQKKVNNYKGKVTGTFVSAEAYDSKINKNIKQALIRYTVNDIPIIKRMNIPKKQLQADTLNIVYNENNPNEAILIGDNSYRKKALINFAISIIFVIILVIYYILFK